MATKIHVTQDDIERGCPNDNNCCPVALALQRTLALPMSAVSVDYSSVDIKQTEGVGKIEYDLPDDVAAFIEEFDRDDEDGDFGPFSFELDLPD